MAHMRFSVATLLWLSICLYALGHLWFLPPYFLTDYRFVNLNTGKVYTLWPVEASGRVALIAATFFLGLPVIRNRFYKQPREPSETASGPNSG
jgi:hypothetical protein